MPHETQFIHKDAVSGRRFSTQPPLRRASVLRAAMQRRRGDDGAGWCSRLTVLNMGKDQSDEGC